MGSSCKYRGSFAGSPATHLLLWGPVPNRLQISTGLWLGGWGPLLFVVWPFLALFLPLSALVTWPWSHWSTWSYRIYQIPTLIPEKAMAPHSSTLAWKIPWTQEPGRLQSMESLRVGHDWATSLSLFTFTHWRRKWQPTPVFLPGESQGRGSLVGCRLWGCTESDTPEAT